MGVEGRNLGLPTEDPERKQVRREGRQSLSDGSWALSQEPGQPEEEAGWSSRGLRPSSASNPWGPGGPQTPESVWCPPCSHAPRVTAVRGQAWR